MKYLSLDGVTKLINKIKSSFVSNANGAIETVGSGTLTHLQITGKIAILSLVDNQSHHAQFYCKYTGSKTNVYIGNDFNPGDLKVNSANGDPLLEVDGENYEIKIMNPSSGEQYTLDTDKCIELGILNK